MVTPRFYESSFGISRIAQALVEVKRRAAYKTVSTTEMEHGLTRIERISQGYIIRMQHAHCRGAAYCAPTVAGAGGMPEIPRSRAWGTGATLIDKGCFIAYSRFYRHEDNTFLTL